MSPIPIIPGVDTAQGIAMTGGTISGYRRVLSMFRKDAEGRLRMLRFFLFGDGNINTAFPEKHLSSLLTQVQALKSASATLGAAELSEEAARIEAFVKDKEFEAIQSSLLEFVEQLSELSQNIRSALELIPEEGKEPTGDDTQKSDISDFLPVFRELAAALKAKKASEIDNMLEELSQKSLNSEIREILEQISDQVLMTEFDSAIKTIDEFIDKNK